MLPGCGGNDWHAETYPASGTVMINGEPAAGAVVELQPYGPEKPDARNSRPWAVVEADGSYTLTTYQKGDGAPVGKYKLTLRWPNDVTSMAQFDRLSGVYARPENAPLEVTIQPEENVLPAVELSNVRVLPADAKPNVPGPPGPGPRAARR